MIIILVTLVAFIIIITVSLQFISRQAHEITNQKQEEISFGLADTGVSYALWLVNYGGFTSETLLASPPGSTLNHVVQDELNVNLGTFSLDFINATTDILHLRSVGTSLAGRCQVIEAELKRTDTSSTVYRLTSWDHKVGYKCCIKTEIAGTPQCNDGIDNDCDEHIDITGAAGLPADLECQNNSDNNEAHFNKKQCNDDLDNDFDLGLDDDGTTPDAQCANNGDESEFY